MSSLPASNLLKESKTVATCCRVNGWVSRSGRPQGLLSRRGQLLDVHPRLFSGCEDDDTGPGKGLAEGFQIEVGARLAGRAAALGEDLLEAGGGAPGLFFGAEARGCYAGAAARAGA